MRQLVLLVGGGGQLGEAMADRLATRHELVAHQRADLDVADAAAVRAAVTSICPDVIVNCTAYTDVDGAEGDPLTALAVNAWAVRTLARLASEIDATFVHFSTDFVFDGDTDRPYTEEDRANPRGMYAVSKLVGEWLAAETPRHFILRVESLFGGPRARSSVDKMLEGISAGRDVRAFSDRVVSPSFVDDVVEATAVLLDGDHPYGLYHCVNTGWATWVEVAREIARLAGRPEAPIIEVKMADAALVAPRPKFAALSNAKLAAAGVPMPTWEDALARYVHRVS